MNQNTSLILKNIAPTVLRIGMALVFLWFGSQQLLHTSMWIGLIPDWVTSLTGFTTATVVHFNGAFEIVFGLALLTGYFTRVTALLLALHMLSITFDIGYTAVGVRDFGLSIAAIAVFLNGSDYFTLDRKLEKTEPTI
jgi:uncharacterized membrane protein YphA (DoxX/SURF4 family)